MLSSHVQPGAAMPAGTGAGTLAVSHQILSGAVVVDTGLYAQASRLSGGPSGGFWGSQVDFHRLLKPELSSISCLQDIRQKFRSVLVEATVKLDELVKKIGKAVEDSKPYWEARRVARQVSAWSAHCPAWRHGHL